jgi:hypothetical protein
MLGVAVTNTDEEEQARDVAPARPPLRRRVPTDLLVLAALAHVADERHVRLRTER